MDLDTKTLPSGIEYCSVCVNSDVKLKSMSKDNYENLLWSLTNTDLSTRPAPHWICFKCEYHLTNFQAFKLMCCEADELIKQYIDNKKQVNLLKLKSEQSRLLKFKSLSIGKTLCIDILPSSDVSEKNFTVSSSHSEIICDETEVNSFCAVKVEIDISDFDDNVSDSSWSDSCNKRLKSKQNVKKRVGKRKSVIESNAKSDDLKSKKLKNKIIIDKTQVQEIRLTDDDVMLERKDRMKSDKYINALYKCEICVLGFAHEYVLKNHMKKHSEERGSHVCSICTVRFGNVLYLNNHLSLHYDRLICNICGKQVDGKRRLADHLAMHAGRTYTCLTCNALFKNRSTLNNHKRNKHKQCEYKCETCNKIFRVKERLKEHELRHSAPKYPCDICDKRFFTVHKLAYHKMKHTDNRHHYCVECDMYFKSESLLKNHLYNAAKHVDPSLLQYPCNQCDKKFRSEMLLTQHMNATHLNRKPFTCEVCASSYASRQGLNFHRRLAHQGYRIPKSHTCKCCNKSFTSKGILVNHLRVHTGEKPFECSQCHRKFSQKSSLRTHIRLVHLKVKRHVKKKEKTEDADKKVKKDVDQNDDKTFVSAMITNNAENEESSYFNRQSHTE